MPMALKSEVPFRVCLFCGANTQGPLGTAWAMYWTTHIGCVRRWLELGPEAQAAATAPVAAAFRDLVTAMVVDHAGPQELCPLCGEGCGGQGPGYVKLRWSAHTVCLDEYLAGIVPVPAEDGVRVTMLLRACGCRPAQRPGNGELAGA